MKLLVAVLVSHMRGASHLCIPFRFLLDNTNKIYASHESSDSFCAADGARETGWWTGQDAGQDRTERERHPPPSPAAEVHLSLSCHVMSVVMNEDTGRTSIIGRGCIDLLHVVCIEYREYESYVEDLDLLSSILARPRSALIE